MRKSLTVAVLNNLLFAALNEAMANREEKSFAWRAAHNNSSVLSLVAVLKGSRDLGELIFEVDEGYERFALDKYFEG